MELETKQPIYRGFAPRRQLVKDTVPRNSSIVAHLQAGGIDEADATALPKALFEIDAQKYQA